MLLIYRINIMRGNLGYFLSFLGILASRLNDYQTIYVLLAQLVGLLLRSLSIIVFVVEFEILLILS